jgi:hypothetical protein
MDNQRQIEKLILIGKYKNNDCHFSKLPKDLIFTIFRFTFQSSLNLTCHIEGESKVSKKYYTFEIDKFIQNMVHYANKIEISTLNGGDPEFYVKEITFGHTLEPLYTEQDELMNMASFGTRYEKNNLFKSICLYSIIYLINKIRSKISKCVYNKKNIDESKRFFVANKLLIKKIKDDGTFDTIYLFNYKFLFITGAELWLEPCNYDVKLISLINKLCELKKIVDKNYILILK